MFSFSIVLAQLRNWDDATTGNLTGCIVDGIPTLKCFEVVFNNILIMSSAVVILVLFIMFVIGSLNYLTSLGNPEKIKKAQGTLKFAIIGFILFISAFLILNIIDILFLGGQGKLFRLEIPN